MRVLNLLNSNHRRGAEAFGTDLGAALARRGAEVRTVALRATTGGPTFDVEAITTASPWHPTALAPLVAHARWADVVIGHGGTTLFAGSLARRLTRTPFVYRVIGEPRRWADTPARRLRVGHAMRSADVVAVYYPSLREELADAFGVRTDRVVVIPKGIDTHLAPADDPARRAARAAFGLDPAVPVVAVLGALDPGKNVGQVIDAVASTDDLQLLIVGDGPARGELARRAERLGSRCVLPAAVAEPAPVLHAADVLAMTSRSEGVPTVLLEAGLAGIGVVATPVGGVADVVLEDQTGYLVPLDDVAATAAALERAVAARDRLGAAGRARVLERFAIDPVADRWLDMLETVVSRPQRRPVTPAPVPTGEPTGDATRAPTGGPRFTVAVATCNHADRLEGVVAAVTAQTCDDWELVVVDDGSTDDTPQRLAAIDEPRLRVVRQPNGGISAARNAGAAAATGRWLVFLDDDDRPAPTWLARFADATDRTGAAVVLCGADLVDADGRPVATRVPPPPDRAAEALSAMAGTFCVRRDVLAAAGGFVDGLPASHQTEVWLRLRETCAARGLTITSVSEPLIRIERRGAGERETRAPEQVLAAGDYILRHHRATLAEQPVELANYLATVGVAAARTGRLRRARSLFWDAATTDPRHPKHAARYLLTLVPPLARRTWG